MDIQYLLFLQNIRDSLGTLIPEFMLSLTKFATSIWPLILVAFVYWVADRRWGRILLGSLSISILLNGFLKATFCVYRPWIRDARVEPYGDAKVSATGYSFPSGHTMYATPTAGGIGVGLRNRHRRLAVICFVYVLLVMFSRNFLGCHTPQDVIVGLLMGLFSIWLSGLIEDRLGKDPSKDVPIILGAAVLAVLLAVYYLNKSYPMDYTAEGKLIADPVPLTYDCFEGLGAILLFSIGRYMERRGFAFDKEMNWKDRFIVAVVASIPLVFWRNTVTGLIFGLNPYLGRFFSYGVEIFYIMVAVPRIMQAVSKSGILNRTGEITKDTPV